MRSRRSNCIWKYLNYTSTTNQASFNFFLPFHLGHNVVINQTQTVNDQPITVDHVSVSPTKTVIYLRAPQLNAGIYTPDPLNSPIYELSIGNWSSLHKTYVIDNTWNDNDDKHQAVEGIELEISYPLLNKTGEWTLLIHYQAIPGATSDVVFHFKI